MPLLVYMYVYQYNYYNLSALRCVMKVYRSGRELYTISKDWKQKRKILLCEWGSDKKRAEKNVCGDQPRGITMLKTIYILEESERRTNEGTNIYIYTAPPRFVSLRHAERKGESEWSKCQQHGVEYITYTELPTFYFSFFLHQLSFTPCLCFRLFIFFFFRVLVYICFGVFYIPELAI